MKENTKEKPNTASFADNLPKRARGETVNILNQTYYKIENIDALRPFFISIVSSYNHWLFISSNGGLSAGRKNSDQALFPYYTEDKITDNYDNTGSKTIFRLTKQEKTFLWEPFSERQHSQYKIERNLYKSSLGTCLIFEEINHSLELGFRYAWRTSEKFGFIRTCWLKNISSSDEKVQIELLDGIQNILPANVSATTQNAFSVLLDAYKLNWLQKQTGLGIFTLNSTLTDLAEPSESLLATTVFQVGLTEVKHLLSSQQLENFRSGKVIKPEDNIRGFRGAYFVNSKFELQAEHEQIWYFAADTPKDAADVVDLLDTLRNEGLALPHLIEEDIQVNEDNLLKLVASADGLQVTSDTLRTTHHFANVVFNSMRGGIFADYYWIDTADFCNYAKKHIHHIGEEHKEFFANLPDKIHILDFYERLDKEKSADLIRLGYTYLPLTFSRRHGDPSRPWNKFAIDIQEEDGTVKLNYEGNWRDIFQNWEALAYSYPEFVEAMICTFLSATTMDGYNPYRISRAGLDWEVPEPGNPWANIGYWGDHQIIYLLKLMEISAKVHPGKLNTFLARPMFSFANIPYRIKAYEDILKDPYNTIDFQYELNDAISETVKISGTDARLLQDRNGETLHRNLTEKLLTLLLAKLVNFVPEGGIWMNTQRPEWNDANNALVGKGLSVVTLGYLRRYVRFCHQLFSQESGKSYKISSDLYQHLMEIISILERFQEKLGTSFTDEQRRKMMDALGNAGSAFRWHIYHEGINGKFDLLDRDILLTFLDLTSAFIDHSLRANRRSDHLFHTYNILNIDEKSASVGHLQEMLEGQVSILSSELLSAEDSVHLLQSLRKSVLYREDQATYILYPDKNLPDFLSKNTLTSDQVKHLQLPHLLAVKGDKTLLVRDLNGDYHFSGGIHNIKDVHSALDKLAQKPDLTQVVRSERNQIAALFEDVFHHDEFTGRSSTFFAYEGLSSVYWHMVSKLLLAAQETAIRHADEPESGDLTAKYHQICAGFGFKKDPQNFGAFPTDPYSHTPKGQGARQPGMTGSVKEEIIARLAELGLLIEDGCLYVDKLLINPDEYLNTPKVFNYLDVNNSEQQLELLPGSLGFTFCQVPIVIYQSNQAFIKVHFADGNAKIIQGDHLDRETSQHIFMRDGTVQQVEVHLA